MLAYLYLTQGNTEAALDQLKRVVALQPKDTVAARLIQRLETTGVHRRLPGRPIGPRDRLPSPCRRRLSSMSPTDP